MILLQSNASMSLQNSSPDFYLLTPSNSSLDHFNLDIDSNVFTYEIESNGTDTVFVKEMYRPFSGADIIQNPVGIWSPFSRLIFTKTNVMARRSDLKGMVVATVTLEVNFIIKLSSWQLVPFYSLLYLLIAD